MEISEDYYFIPYYFYFENTNVTVVTEWIQITETFRLLVEFLSLLSVPYLHPSLRKRRDETCSPVPFTGLGLPWIGPPVLTTTSSSESIGRLLAPTMHQQLRCSRWLLAPSLTFFRWWRRRFFEAFPASVSSSLPWVSCSNQLPVSTIDCFFLPWLRLMHLRAFFNH